MSDNESTARLAVARDGSPPADGAFVRSIGPYRLIELLGAGGMGAVYLAEQTEPVTRLVALKVIRTTVEGGAAAARFSAERQALARLSHPNIAAMYDAGATEAGFPFFAMERIAGLPVDDYADRNRLTIRERIGLLVQICRGVQHAHQKGVIHRDLKSSNVLVAEVEGQPVPKIIDFGIAKAIDHPLTEVTAVLTKQGVIGTPAYMSPEALRGDDLDTRTDIYSLGVLMYELLAGVRPHQIDDLPIGAVIRMVTENDAPLPRTIFRTLSEADRARIADMRREDIRALETLLGGDLGWIARKATARDREERYESAADLAADLLRHLRHEPVVARPPSLRDRTRKFARRHRAAVVAAIIVAVALIGAIAGTTTSMLRARRAQAEAEAVSGFLTELLESASPWQRRNETTVRELLEEAADRIPTALADEPAARAELLVTIGSSEFHLGHLERAEALLREALRLRVEMEGNDSPRVARVLNQLGLVRKHQDHLDDAERMLRASLAIGEKAYGNSDDSVARARFDLASILAMRGKNAEAETAYRDALTLREKLFAEHNPNVDAATVALTMNGLGLHLARTGRLPEAELRIRQSLDIRRRANSQGYAYAMSVVELGNVVAAQNRFAEAEVLIRDGMGRLAKFVEPGDGRLQESEAALAEVMRKQGK